jgi:ABC-type uncharacterized transport system substrate-binding protein
MLKKSSFSVVILLFCLKSFSHPHVWVDNKIKPVLDSEGITGFFVEWIFDETTSAVVLEDFDTDKDGKFSKEETEVVYNETFRLLAEDNFYTRIKVDGKDIPIQTPDSLVIETDGWVNTYRFFISCPVKVSSNPQKVILSQYDDTYFIDFAISKKVELQRLSGNYQVKTSVEEDKESSFYFDQVTPVVVKITLEK